MGSTMYVTADPPSTKPGLAFQASACWGTIPGSSFWTGQHGGGPLAGGGAPRAAVALTANSRPQRVCASFTPRGHLYDPQPPSVPPFPIRTTPQAGADSSGLRLLYVGLTGTYTLGGLLQSFGAPFGDTGDILSISQPNILYVTGAGGEECAVRSDTPLVTALQSAFLWEVDRTVAL